MLRIQFFGRTIVLMLTACLTSPALAGGVHIGNGGDVIACHDDVTPKISSLEYWLANLIRLPDGTQPPEFLRFQTLRSEKDIKDFFYKKLEVVPWFMDKLKRNEALINQNEIGLSATPLVDIEDDGLFVNLPENCRKVQAIVRRADHLFWDEEIYQNISLQQKALLQMHEIIYMTAVIDYHRESSQGAQDLIIHLLTANPPQLTAESLARYIRNFF